MKSIFDEKPKTQQEIYSPTPTIKIKRWYEKICIACNYVVHDYGEYDNVGWWECDKPMPLGNLKAFPYCNAKSCKHFEAKDVIDKESDYWSLIGCMYSMKLKEGLDSKIAWSVIEFNERMGDYKVGRII